MQWTVPATGIVKRHLEAGDVVFVALQWYSEA
jgi:hypothetical protein